ncbi:MAG: hypothetical protein QG597_4624 [Actinomycetota bacterium]|nr:hypothetical protein [Actinomycetota bacterium]
MSSQSDDTALESTRDAAPLLAEILSLIAGARRRLWIKVPWWDHTSANGRELGRAVDAACQRGVDVRVIMRNDASSLSTVAALRQRKVPVRCVRYLHEKELIADDAYLMHSMNFTRAETERNSQVGTRLDDGIQAAADMFERAWTELSGLDRQRGEEVAVAARAVVPDSILPLLEHQRLNPFQADVAPAVLSTTGHVVVVAPTGAGKSLIGELAILRAVKLDKRKAVWLVPARALASELGRLRKRWAAHGITVETLTGESNLSSDRLRHAHVWIATTEKFESLCRRATLAAAVADVGCIVVDEIHLVGDPTRGGTLEALLARLRLLSDTTRIVGLSATVANADEVADWLGADLLRSTWRPTVLVTQMIDYEPASDRWADVERAKDGALLPLIRSILAKDDTDDPAASVLVFTGSKAVARRLACQLAQVTDPADEEGAARACMRKGVGFHYRGAPLADEALAGFRGRTVRALFATSGLSTGINTPARVVVVRDLTLGTTDIDVSQVQQMFGRAGRAGLELEGYAYILVPKTDHGTWQQKLTDGYRVTSRLSSSLADAALAEIHLGNIGSSDDVEKWFASTFAAHQSTGTGTAAEVLSQLTRAGVIVTDETGRVAATELGRLTSQLMVDVASAEAVQANLKEATPTTADQAELLVLGAVVRGVRTLAERQVNPREWTPIVDVILGRYGAADVADTFGSRFSLASCLLALHEPARLLTGRRSGQLDPLPLRDVLDEAPRFITWVGELGRLGRGTWQSLVATDLAERISARGLQPPPGRGSGRLLRYVRSMVEPEDAAAFLVQYWPSAAHYSGPQDLPGIPADDRVVAMNRDRSVANRLAPGPPSYVQGGGDLAIETGISGSIVRQVVLVGCGLDMGESEAAQGGPVTVPLPPGAHRSGRVTIEAVSFSRGDGVYSTATLAITPTQPEPDDMSARIERARSALSQAQDVAVVTARPGRWKRLRQGRDEVERRELVQLAAQFQPLTATAHAITHGLEPLAAAWALKESFVAFCPTTGAWPVTRSPLTVLRSGEASPTERSLTLSAMARAAGLESRLVQSQSNNQIHCAVEVDHKWTVLEVSMPPGPFTGLSDTAPREIYSLPPKPEPAPLTAIPRMAWLGAFTTNAVNDESGAQQGTSRPVVHQETEP